ncbi:MAG: flagellar basal body-associated FliL family protein [gamma proteobacterium symbiont of Taylorina sp.]|nr:flagellar basal body-associated FliL family protein [gamma proteobacterium symbiont of Taylorina sp.]
MQKMNNLTLPLNNYLKVLLLLILAVGLMTPLYAADEEEEEVDETVYFELSPPFVVNLQTKERRMRFLQVRLQVLGLPEAIEAVKTHDAPLRDVIITALSAQTRDSVNTPKKKKALQLEIQKEVEKVLEDLTGNKQIEGLYFTNFVIQ